MFFVVLILLYAGFALTKTLWQSYRMSRQINSLEDEIARLEERKRELQNLITYYKTDSYKEKEARRRLGYQKPGERVLIVVPQKEAKEEPLPQPPKPNWRIWWEFFFS